MAGPAGRVEPEPGREAGAAADVEDPRPRVEPGGPLLRRPEPVLLDAPAPRPGPERGGVVGLAAPPLEGEGITGLRLSHVAPGHEAGDAVAHRVDRSVAGDELSREDVAVLRFDDPLDERMPR